MAVDSLDPFAGCRTAQDRPAKEVGLLARRIVYPHFEDRFQNPVGETIGIDFGQQELFFAASAQVGGQFAAPEFPVFVEMFRVGHLVAQVGQKTAFDRVQVFDVFIYQLESPLQRTPAAEFPASAVPVMPVPFLRL